MREIKFRAWNKQTKRLVSNDVFRDIGRELVEFAKKSMPKSRVIANAKGGLLIANDADELVFMQFTGLQDRKNKDIYEGDIMDYFTYVMCNERRKGIVCFDEKQSKYKIVPFEMYELNAGNGGYTGHSFDSAICAGSEVIGNVYENPELLAPKEGAEQ
ncbi:YopX family protein [Paenibacillus sp. FSL K6-0108]|uniref:YopX family protein n=1 Tax=Paenibacillus sp. FSL K6-0108 TaxID=2921417 RepID=UPI00324A3A2D